MLFVMVFKNASDTGDDVTMYSQVPPIPKFRLAVGISFFSILKCGLIQVQGGGGTAATSIPEATIQ